MKKVLLFAFALSIATSFTMAQGKSGHKKNKGNKGNKEWKSDKRDDHDDDDRDGKYGPMGKKDGDGRYDQDNRGNRGGNGKYSKNIPTRVRESFNRDYPNATNVSWTKDRGTWTATFDGGGIFSGRNRTATYHANGNRVDASGTYTNRDNGPLQNRNDGVVTENRNDRNTGAKKDPMGTDGSTKKTKRQKKSPMEKKDN